MGRTNLIILAGVVAAGCSHRPLALTPEPRAQATPAPASPTVNDSLEASRMRSEEELAARRRADSLAALDRENAALRDTLANLIHFAFDKAWLSAGDRATLDNKSAILAANPALRIEIAGNCDERGSDEYNLALGNRRAIAAKTYLVEHGVPASRIQTISNGKERPLDPGHTERAWAMNRNDQFAILTPNVVFGRP